MSNNKQKAPSKLVVIIFGFVAFIALSCIKYLLSKPTYNYSVYNYSKITDLISEGRILSFSVNGSVTNIETTEAKYVITHVDSKTGLPISW